MIWNILCNSKVDSLEQYNKRNNIRVVGLKLQGGDAEQEINALLNDKLGLGIDMTSIDRIQKIGSDGKSALIVRFTSYLLRDRVYRSRIKLKLEKSTNQIYFNNDLTTTRSEIFRKARQLKKSRAIIDCWTWDGQIMVKDKMNKITRINKLNDLDVY